MKILYVAFVNSPGGASVALVNIVKGMVGLGHEVFILTNTSRGYITDQLKGYDVSVLTAPISLTIYPKGRRITGKLYWFYELFYKWPKTLRILKKAIDKYKFDLIHTNSGPCILPFLAARKKQIPHVWHMREYQDLDFGMKVFPSRVSFMKLIHSAENNNIAITQGVFNHWELRESIDEVIYDGVFQENYVTPNVEKEDTILYVGRIQEAKGLLELLEAFKLFHEEYPDYKLKVAGSNAQPVYYNTCMHFIIENNLSSHIELLGERNDIYHLMAKAKILVVPSRFEGFGFIVVEGMLNNCIVIGKNRGGIAEQFDRGFEQMGAEIGYRYKDALGLLDSLKRAVTEDTTDQVQRANKMVRNNYSVEHNIEILNKYYLKIMGIS